MASTKRRWCGGPAVMLLGALAVGCGDNLAPFVIEALGAPPLDGYALTFGPDQEPIAWGRDAAGQAHFLEARGGDWVERWGDASLALAGLACTSLTTFGRDGDGAPLALGCGAGAAGVYRVDDGGLTPVGPPLPITSPFLPNRDGAGAYYVADERSPDLWRLGPGATAWATIDRPSPTSWSMRVGPDGRLYEITQAGIRRVDAAGVAAAIWTCPAGTARCPTSLVGFAPPASAGPLELFVSTGVEVWSLPDDGSRPPRVLYAGIDASAGQLHAVSAARVLYLAGPGGLDAYQLAPEAAGGGAPAPSRPAHLADFEAVLLRIGPDGALYARDADGGLHVVRAY